MNRILFILLLAFSIASPSFSQCFSPNWSGNGLDQMNVYIMGATLNGVNLQNGDQVGVFDGSNCVGTGTYSGSMLSIICSKDDPVTTGVVDGYIAGHTMSFKICDESSGQTVTDISVALNAGTLTFEVSGSTFVTLTATLSCTNPDPPQIGTITQPSCSVATGSVQLNGLPSSGSWTINPGSISGSGTSTVIEGLTTGSYSWTVTNSLGCTSESSLSATIDPQPQAPAQPGVISGSATVCQSTQQTYSVTAVSGATSYTWTLPSGWTGSSSTNSITATVGANGGDISVTASNACGNSSARTLAVTTTSAPAQPGSITGDIAVCQSGTEAYSIDPVSGATSYTWTLPNGWTGSSSTTSISATIGANGGNVSVAAGNSCGTSTARTLAVTVSTLPAQPGTITGSATPCQGSSQTYSVAAVSGATSYSWSLPAGWTGSSTTNSITVTVGSGNGNVSVAAINDCGTGTARNLAVTVSNAPAQPGTISGSTTVCQGTEQTYSVTAVSGATSYTWTLPSGWTGSSSTNSITATVGANGGDISVTATNACGTSSARTLAVTTTSAPAQPGSITGDIAVCQSGTESYSIDPVSGATSYTWTLPAGWTGSSTSTSISATVGANGGNVSVAAGNSCGTSTARTLAVTVSTLPAQPGTITGSATPCQGTSQTYSVGSVSGATSYTWSLPSGWSGTSTTNSITVTVGSGNGNISVTANNDCGSGTARLLAVAVSAPPLVPGSISGNTTVCQGSSNTYSVTAVSGATSYTWSLPSGWTGSSTTNSITVAAGTTGGDISVTATNACGTSPARTLAVTTTSAPAQPGSITGDIAVCQSGTESYSIDPVSGATSYTWTLPNGWTGSSSTTSISATVGANGGNVSVAANNSCGTSTARTLAVTVSTLPAQPGTISGSATPCQGSSQTYSVAAVSGATSYTWTLPSGWTGTSTTNSITVTVGSGNGNVSVAAINDCGTGTARNLAVTVSNTPAQPGAISGSASVCQGTQQTYSVTAVSGATSYTWTLPSGWTGSSSTNSITATVGANGGDISVTATNACGTSSARTLAVTTTSAPAQPGSITGDIAVCQSGTESYSIDPVSGATSYTWTLPAGWTGSSTSTSISATVGANGGNVSVAAGNSCGTSTARTLAVTVSTLPAQPGTITGSATPCQGSSQTYSVAAVSGATSYSWSLPAGWTGSSTTNSITVTVGSGNGNVSVAAINNCGTGTARNLAVTVSNIPAQPGAISGSTTVCQGTQQTYSVTAVSGATSYTWTLPSGWTGSSTTNSITATVGANGGDISVTATNACGTSSSRTLAVATTTVPAQPGTITGDATVCQNGSELYSIDPVAGATSYTWTLPNGWTGSSTSISITATVGANNGNVSVAANNTCGAGTARSLAVTVSTVPAQPGTMSGSATPCQGSSQTYSVGAVSGATSYSWSLPAGWTGSSTTNSITVTVGSGNGNVSVTANNECGAGTARNLAVTVSNIPAQPGTISGSTTVCQGTQQTYSVTAVSGATSYTWTLPSGWTGSSTTNSISVTVGANGGDISVTATNACGTSSARTLAVTTTTVPAQPGTISGNSSVCQGASETYSIAAVSGATSYTWTLPSGSTGTSTTTSINAVIGSTNGNVTVTANNSCGSGTARSLALTVSPLPAQPGAITGNSSVCQGVSQTYSISAVSGATSYSWSLPAGWTGTSTTTSITATAGSSGYISVIANNGCGSGTARTLSVTSSTKPDQPEAITGSASVCQGSSQTYTVPGVTGATSYTWTIPAGWTGTSTTNSITTTVGNNGGNITVTASNSCGTSTAQSLTVTTSTVPAQPGTISGNTAICQNSNQTYSVTAVAGATSYTWTLPNGWTGSSTTNSITATVGATSGNITVTANNSCGAGTARTLAVTVSTVPAQPGTITGSVTPCQGTSQTYTVTAVSGATSYTWTLPSGWTGTSTTNSITTTVGATNGNISVTANNDCGPGTARTLSVTVSAIPTQPGSVSGSTTVCQGSSQTYSVTTVSGATSYNWTLPSGWTGSSSTNSITVTVGSTGGNISVTASNACGTSIARTIAVTTTTVPAQPASITGDAAVCQGTSEAYSIAAVSGATSYTWTLPTGWTGSSTSNSINTTVGATSGNITVTANNGCGSGLARNLAVSVSTVPGQPGSITGSASVCQGTSQTYTIGAVSGATSYTWNMPADWTGTSNTTSITATAGSGGTVSVTANNGCGSGTARTLAVSVSTVPSQPGTINGSISVCQGSSQTYSISAVSGATSYTWSMPSGWTGSSTTNSITSTVGTNGGSVSVTANNGCGSSTARSLSVTVNTIPTAPVTGAVTQPSCEVSTGSVALSGLPATGSWTITASPGSITRNGSGSIYTFSGLNPGTYTFTVANAGGCVSPASGSVTLHTVPSAPSVPVVGTVTQPACGSPKGSVSFSGLPSSGTWTLTGTGGVSKSGTGTTTTITDLNPGTYKFLVTNSDGCSSPETENVILQALTATPSAPVTGTLTQPSCSQPYGSLELTGLPGTGTWTLITYPGQSTVQGTGTTHLVSNLTAGTYSFSVKAGNSCESESTPDVVINEAPELPEAPGIVTVILPTCQVATATIELNNLPAAGSWTVTGVPEQDITGSGSSLSIENLAAGTYRFKVINGSGCESPESDIVTIPEQPVTPALPVIDSIIQPTCALGTGSIKLSNLPATGEWTLVIKPDSVLITGTGIDTTIDALEPGIYSFMVKGESGCVSAETNDTTIFDQPAGPDAPVITQTDNTLHSSVVSGNQWYNEDGIITGETDQTFAPDTTGSYYAVVTVDGCSSVPSNTIHVIITGVDNSILGTSILMYPNPVKNELVVEFRNYIKEVRYELVNSNGKTVANGLINERKVIETGSLPSGIYLLKLESDDGYVIRKLIKD